MAFLCFISSLSSSSSKWVSHNTLHRIARSSLSLYYTWFIWMRAQILTQKLRGNLFLLFFLFSFFFIKEFSSFDIQIWAWNLLKQNHFNEFRHNQCYFKNSCLTRHKISTPRGKGVCFWFLYIPGRWKGRTWTFSGNYVVFSWLQSFVKLIYGFTFSGGDQFACCFQKATCSF